MHQRDTSLAVADTKKYTVCPRSSDPFYEVTYYLKWVTISWTDGIHYIPYTYIIESYDEHIYIYIKKIVN